MADLKKEAEDLGIVVDGRWSDETLQQKIDEALAQPPATPAELYPIRLLADWWDLEGVRHPAGETVNMPMTEAQKLMSELKGEYAGKMIPSAG